MTTTQPVCFHVGDYVHAFDKDWVLIYRDTDGCWLCTEYDGSGTGHDHARFDESALTPTTDVEIAERQSSAKWTRAVTATTSREVLVPVETANLGLATTEELFDEIIARLCNSAWTVPVAVKLARELGGLRAEDREYRTVA